MSTTQRTGCGEYLSRAVFGGFWSLLTVSLLVAGIVGVSRGENAGLLAIGGSLLTGAYSVYIFRGGRFRFLFW